MVKPSYSNPNEERVRNRSSGGLSPSLCTVDNFKTTGYFAIFKVGFDYVADLVLNPANVTHWRDMQVELIFQQVRFDIILVEFVRNSDYSVIHGDNLFCDFKPSKISSDVGW